MSGCDGQTDGDGRCDGVAPVCFVAYRVYDQDQNQGNERFDDEPLARV